MDRNDGARPRFGVSRLTVQDYRVFRLLDVRFVSLNVFLGINGSGKTTLLQALAVCLSRFTSRLVNGRAAGLQILDADIHADAPWSMLHLKAERDTMAHQLWVTRVRRGRKGPGITIVEGGDAVAGFFSQPREATFNRLADGFREGLTSDPSASIPVVAFYPVNRAVLDVPLRIRGPHKFDQLAAYGGAFDTQRNFRTFFEWFRAREDLENERRVDRKSYRDPQLEAVRVAVEAFMEGCTELRVRRNPLRMTLMKGRQELQVNQLSDGEKVVLSLVGDLARRLAIANPGLEHPLEGLGCALVDEIDLHLHPSWQRQIVQKLPKVFPNLQFFLTTHSPIIAGATPADSLFVLEGGKVMNASVYGQDAGLILAEVFDTPPRPESVRSELDALFLAIAEKRKDAPALLDNLEHKVSPSDPELVKARILMRGARRP